jgi:Ca2+-binding RTX toxin-like protein
VNGDGFADLMIASPSSLDHPGQAFVVFGGNFTNSVMHLGSPTGDTLTGNASPETFVGGDSRDVIYGNGGEDVIQGGGGSDLIHVLFGATAGESYTDVNHNSQYDLGEPFVDSNQSGTYDGPKAGPAQFAHVDGGSGYDFLYFDNGGSMDFGNLDGNPATSDRGKISNIEALDFNNGQSNDITLHKADVLDMDPSDFHYVGNPTPERVLHIFGDGKDTLHLAASDGWSGPDTSSGYAVYASQDVKIAVDLGVHVTVV